jgi:hypothetical protein
MIVRIVCRARLAAFALVMSAVAASVVVACVIVEEPGEILQPILRPPSIEHAQVDPPAVRILQTWPAQFVVPIDVPPGSPDVAWRAFVDYDPVVGGDGYVGNTLVRDRSNVDAGTLLLTVRLQDPPEIDRCHTVEIVVAYLFVTTHAPDSRGGDTVSWFYAPSGSIADCPIYDAGPVPDAGTDGASDAGAAVEGGDT